MSRIKFVKGKINGKKGMLMGLIVAAAIIISGISLIMPAKGNGATPLTIVGYVYYQDGTPAANVFVNLTDVNNGNYSVNWTDASGRYSITFGGAGGVGWNVGDKLVGFATNSTGAQGSNDTIMQDVGTIWLNFTIDTPITVKHLIGMKCLTGLYITLNTTFNFTATDKDGINATYVRIWHNGWYPTPGTGKGKDNNFYIYDNSSVYGIPKNFTLWELNQTKNIPAEEGKYYIEFYSDDKNTTMQGIEYTHNQTHIVDETIPTTSYSFGNPKVTDGLVIIGPNTPLWLNASDSISGVKEIHYSIWRNTTHPGDWEKIYEGSVYYNNSNGQNRTVSLPLYFKDGCFHEVKWRAYDCVGHETNQYTVEFAVDVVEPTINLAIGKPNYIDDNGSLWVNCSTPIWVNATDTGCPGKEAGVEKIIINVFWNETKGDYFNHNYTIVVKDNNVDPQAGPIDLNPEYGKISYKLVLPEECFHEPEFHAIDYVGNEHVFKKQFFVDCKPPWVNKTISKVAFIKQMKNDSSVEIVSSEGEWGYWQEFIANWSYVDAVNVSICGEFYGYGIMAQIYDESRTILLGESDFHNFVGSYCGWVQLHLKNRIYLQHGAHYWLRIVPNGVPFYWNGNNTNPYAGNSIVNGVLNHTWDFAFKLEYYPIYPYFYPMEYSFKNGSYEHNGLNGTWITSKAFFNIDYGDEGCMGGVGVASVKYRIWNGSWTPWMNYTTPFNLSDECKHYIEVNVTDHLGQSTILNQTHYVDNSPPTDVVNIPDKHGYYYYDGKQYVRAGYGIWINLTDQPECAVGLREATFYWRYTYYNFTTPFPESHPNSTNDVHNGFTHIVEKDGKYWYVVHLNTRNYSVFINFSRECMHDIYYFYNATDWLDNNITSEIKHIRLYVDKYEPKAWAKYPWHYYQKIDNESGYIRAGANFTLYAKDMPNPIPMMCIAQINGSQRDSLQNYSYTSQWPWDAQSFVAKCHHVNETRLYLNWTGNATVTVYIHDENMTILGSSTTTLTNSGEGWVSFVFNPGIDTVIGNTYYIEVHVSADSAPVDWFYSAVDEYPDGSATISSSSHPTYDWKFEIISDEENPCASGAEGIYYGYYYKDTWYPEGPGEGVLDIGMYYNESEIDNAFMGHHYWYVVNDSSPMDRDARHGYIEANVSFNEECVHYFYYWTKDNVCHHSELYHHTFYVDDSSPEVSIEMPSCYSGGTGAKMDIVFLIDTSGSMGPVWDTLDSDLNSLINSIRNSGVDLNVTVYALGHLPGVPLPNISSFTYPMTTTWFNGANISIPNDESWGTALSWIALWYPWRENAIRVAIPISDECAYNGGVSSEDANDMQAVNESSSLCANNSVIVFPFYHTLYYTPPLACIPEMEKVANATGGAVFNITDMENFSSVFLSVFNLARGAEYISCNATIHLSAIDYPVTTGKIVDQQQTTGIAWDAIENITGLYTAQSFIPTVDKLDAVQLLLKIGNVGAVNVSIYDSGLNLLGYSNMTLYPSDQGSDIMWVQFHFTPGINLTIGETYWISVAAYPNGSIIWLWNNQSDAYGNGYMIRTGGLDTLHDYAFKTEYYGDVEAECSAGLEGIYYGYEYDGVWHPASVDDNVTEHGTVFNISNYYSPEEINNSFGGHTLWYVYNDSLGITFFKECRHDLYYWAKDNVCHHSVIYHRTLYVDNTEPEITKTHPSHGYEVVDGKPYLRAGANITLYADDMPDNNCSSGTWLYWRYVWNDSGELKYYPFFYHEGFENNVFDNGWDMLYNGWWAQAVENHSGSYSMKAYSNMQGWSWLVSDGIALPDVSRITLTFWQRADNLGYYDAANIFGIENETGAFIPLKFFYKDDMSTNWQKVTIDLTPYANQTIKLIWVYENDYGDGETWYIDDINITGWYGKYGYDNVSVNISFNEECHHDLYYFAKDTTCHSTQIYHQEYYVDGTAPETDLHVITNGYRPEPYYSDEFDYVICINDSINLTTNNSGKEPCIFPYTQTYYRWVWIDENGTKHYYPDATDPHAIDGSTLQVSSYANEIEPYYWLPYNGTFKFTEGCVHWLYFFSKDNLSNTEEPHNVSFGVDDKPPVTTIDFEGASYVPDPNIIYVRNNTIIWINATDLPNYPNCTTGINYTLYAIWKYNYSKPGWDLLVPWRSTNDPVPPGITIHVYDDGTSARRISIEINIAELVHPYIEEGIYDTDCGKYEIHWRSVDYNGLMEMEHDKDIIVDCTPPDSTKEFGSPNVPFYLQAELMHWISSATPIYINGTDDKVWDSGVAKVCIMYKKVDEIKYTKLCVNGSNGVFHITGEDGKYRIFHWAVDNVGHAQDYNLTKQHVYLDNSPPTSRVDDIIPWERSSVPFDITVTNITDHGPEVMGKEGVGVCKVEVYYRYSWDNVTWGPWVLYATNTSLITNPDGSVADWILSFMPPAGEHNGYFQFKSIAYDCLNNVEQPPFYYGDYDAWCHVITDHDAPNVTKEYGQPSRYMDLGGGEMGHVITSHTMIYINATDLPDEANASGIDKIYWSFDGLNWYNTTSYNGAYTAEYSFTPADLGLSEGSVYQIFIKATDRLGHVSEQLKQKFTIDDTAPNSVANATCHGKTIYVTATASDNFVGVEKVELFGRYSENGTTWTTWTSYGYGTYNASSGKWEWTLENMDVGYYEFYTIATDYLGNVEAAPPTPDTSCQIKQYPPWDVNMDDSVDVLDMIIIAQHWMETPNSPNWYDRADVNGDGIVNVLDLIIVGQHFTSST